MVAGSNNNNIAVYCDVCGKSIHFGESYYVDESLGHICEECMYRLLEKVFTGE